MPKDLFDGLIALIGLFGAFLIVSMFVIVFMAMIKWSYYNELTKEIKLSNKKRENEPRKVVIVNAKEE